RDLGFECRGPGPGIGVADYRKESGAEDEPEHRDRSVAGAEGHGLADVHGLPRQRLPGGVEWRQQRRDVPVEELEQSLAFGLVQGRQLSRGSPPEYRAREYRMPGAGLRPLRGRRLDQLERRSVLAPGHPAQQRLPEARYDFGSKVVRECEEQLRLDEGGEPAEERTVAPGPDRIRKLRRPGSYPVRQSANLGRLLQSVDQRGSTGSQRCRQQQGTGERRARQKLRTRNLHHPALADQLAEHIE